jgi:peptide subunit release factor 1 (eRF1)
MQPWLDQLPQEAEFIDHIGVHQGGRMATDVRAALEELTAYPSTEYPFLSVYLDMQVDSQGVRFHMAQLTQALDRIAHHVPGSGHHHDSFVADRERIMHYVENDAPTDAQGVAIFACHAEGVWQTLELQVPVETQIVEDRYPYTFQLARVLDDHETFAVVLAQGQESHVFVVALDAATQVAETESSEKIQPFNAGEGGQGILQRRRSNIIKAQMKDLATELERVMKRYDVQHVIVAGNDSIKGAVLDTFPATIKDKVVDYINLDARGGVKVIMDAIEPLMREVERQQEADDVQDLQANVATQPGLGVIGIEATALALSKGQVRTLLMLGDFHAAGRRNPTSGFLYTGLRTTDPYDGSALEPVELREAFTALAVQSSTEIQVVESDAYLAEHEGVGAVLWYNDTQQPQTVDTNP